MRRLESNPRAKTLGFCGERMAAIWGNGYQHSNGVLKP